MSTSTSTVAGLPQFVVLRAKSNGNYLQYQWNDEFGDFYKYMGIRRVVDEVSPFVKIEVVPSTTDTSFVHLKSSYNEKYFELVRNLGVNLISATAEAPEEDLSKPTCTLFEPVFPSDQPNTVWFRYVPSQAHLFRFNNTSFPDMYNIAIVYSQNLTLFFEFAAWESYEDKMKAKDDVIKAKDLEIKAKDDEIKAKDAEIKEKVDEIKAKDDVIKVKDLEIKAKDDEIKAKNAEIKEKDDDIKAKDDVIRVKNEEIRVKDEEIQKLKEQVAALELKEEERKVKLAEEMVKLQTAATSAWETFQKNITVTA
ncbi:hypothetical protein LINPERHAP2_LOCUS2180 [Linum perenne]